MCVCVCVCVCVRVHVCVRACVCVIVWHANNSCRLHDNHDDVMQPATSNPGYGPDGNLRKKDVNATKSTESAISGLATRCGR